jgi:hypothetical protein
MFENFTFLPEFSNFVTNTFNNIKAYLNNPPKEDLRGSEWIV